jgi:hypothetical protein
MSNSLEQPSDTTRVIAVVLSEREWRAFRAVEAEPVDWLQQKIRERIEAGRDEASSAPAA